MAIHILFMQNLLTQEEFVASIDAQSVDDAKRFCRATYPANVYAVLTCYAQKELETVLTNLKRWPGVPSKVQPPVEELMERVHAGVGGLPPLRQARPTAGSVRTVQPEELDVMMRVMAEQTAARTERLNALMRGEAVPPLHAADRVAAKVQATEVAAKPAAPVAAPVTAAPRQSVLEALKGISPAVAAAQAVSPTVPAPAARATSPANNGKSVVELLRGLRG